MAEEEFQEEQLPLETVGQRLRRAREAAGLSIADVCDETKIAKRHISAIEEDRFADLAGRTYAVGFSRAYAKAVGVDEAGIADAVRDQLAAEEEHWPAPKPDGFEPGDPARVPPAGIAWAGGLGALVVLVLLFVFWRSYISPAGSIGGAAQDAPRQAAAAAKPPRSAGTSPVAASGPVVFTAAEPDIWVRFYDAAGARLFEKQMALGESYTVPATADGPMIRTARPDALRITIGGEPALPLGEDAVVVSDVPVSAAALLARNRPQAADVATPQSGSPARATASVRPRTRSAVSSPPVAELDETEPPPETEAGDSQSPAEPSTVSD